MYSSSFRPEALLRCEKIQSALRTSHADAILLNTKGIEFIMKITNIEEQTKDGTIEINKTNTKRLILTTCSKKDKNKQLVITSELKKDDFE